VSRWLQTELADFSTLNMEAIHSSETSGHTRSTRRHIPEDGILFAYIIGNSMKPCVLEMAELMCGRHHRKETENIPCEMKGSPHESKAYYRM
jgi:hypothetical protein